MFRPDSKGGGFDLQILQLVFNVKYCLCSKSLKYKIFAKSLVERSTILTLWYTKYCTL